jgi:hypothetical protein
MNAPSDDQTGLDETESTSRVGAPTPSTGTFNTRSPRPSRAATASRRPSGYHDAVPRTSSCSATGRTSVPVDAGAMQSRTTAAAHGEADALSIRRESGPADHRALARAPQLDGTHAGRAPEAIAATARGEIEQGGVGAEARRGTARSRESETMYVTLEREAVLGNPARSTASQWGRTRRRRGAVDVPPSRRSRRR